MQQEPMVLWQAEGRVGRITLNRPGAGNAVHLPFAHAFADAVGRASEAAARGQIGCVLLAARGRHFCVGGDIQAFVEHKGDLPVLVDTILQLVHPAVHALATLPVPVISAVQGALGGAGTALALCADFVLACDAIKLRGGYTAIGLSPDGGASWFVTRRAGAAAAKRIFMLNQNIGAHECLRLGLVDELHALPELLPAAMRLAQELASGATGALAAVKQLCDGAGRNDLHAHLQLERNTLLARAGSADSREGIQAFIDKRTPDFSSKSTN